MRGSTFAWATSTAHTVSVTVCHCRSRPVTVCHCVSLSVTACCRLCHRYVAWATSKEYIEIAATELSGGWAAVPPGTRASTYANANYQAAAAPFAARASGATHSAVHPRRAPSVGALLTESVHLVWRTHRRRRWKR